jgi:hypothetical protein
LSVPHYFSVLKCFLLIFRRKIDQLSCDARSPLSEKDISCALVLLKKRHRLSARCINDIISLLRKLNVPNVPTSWYQLKKDLTEAQSSRIQTFICPECQGASTCSSECSQCSTDFNATEKPNSFFSFSIYNQIERIVYYNKDLLLTHRSYSMSMKDIRD